MKERNEMGAVIDIDIDNGQKGDQQEQGLDSVIYDVESNCHGHGHSHSRSHSRNANGSSHSHSYKYSYNYKIHFRPLRESDRSEIKELHEELFPVEYTDYFYDTVVRNRAMVDEDKPIFSCVAVAAEDSDNDSSDNDSSDNASHGHATINKVSNGGYSHVREDGMEDGLIKITNNHSHSNNDTTENGKDKECYNLIHSHSTIRQEQQQHQHKAWEELASYVGIDSTKIKHKNRKNGNISACSGLYETWRIKEDVTADHLHPSCSQLLLSTNNIHKHINNNYINNSHQGQWPKEGRRHGEIIVGCVVGTFIDITPPPPISNSYDESENSSDDNNVNLSPNTIIQIQTTQLLIRNIKRHTKMFYIMTLGSKTQFRNKGLASKLIRDCIDLVEQVEYCGVIYLHVITYNTTAIRFYEKLGFYKMQMIKDYYTIDGKYYDCYLYARFVNGNRRSFKSILSSAYEQLLSYFTTSTDSITTAAGGA